mgnify:CR=1 FL=1
MSKGWPFCFGGSMLNRCSGVFPEGSFFPHCKEAPRQLTFGSSRAFSSKFAPVFLSCTSVHAMAQQSPPKNASLRRSASVVLRDVSEAAFARATSAASSVLRSMASAPLAAVMACCQWGDAAMRAAVSQVRATRSSDGDDVLRLSVHRPCTSTRRFMVLCCWFACYYASVFTGR